MVEGRLPVGEFLRANDVADCGIYKRKIPEISQSCRVDHATIVALEARVREASGPPVKTPDRYNVDCSAMGIFYKPIELRPAALGA